MIGTAYHPIAEFALGFVAGRPRLSDHGGVSDLDLSPSAASPGGPPSEQVESVVTRAVDAHRGERGPLLSVLNDVAAALGYVPEAAVRLLARQMNLSRADVHGVVSFYKDLRTQPVGACLVQLCRGEACQSVGGEAVVGEVADRLGVPLESTAADGSLTLEEVFCLGNCALGPSGLVAGRLHGRLTADRVVALVEQQRGAGGAEGTR